MYVKRLFKWLFYLLGFALLLITAVLAGAYWNRDKLLTRLNAELNKGINGKVHIETIDFTFLHHFPNFSITLRRVYLRDDQYHIYSRDVFTANKIVVDVALFPLVKREVKIKSLTVDGADIFLFKARNGDTNAESNTHSNTCDFANYRAANHDARPASL